MPRSSVTAALIVAAVLVAAIAVTAMLLPDTEPAVLPPAPRDEVVAIYPDGARSPGEPLACVFELECLMEQIERARGVPAPGAAPDVAPTPPAEVIPAAT